MKEAWSKLKEWWSNLALREKLAISIGSAALLIFIGYQWVLTPYLAHITQMRQQIVINQKKLLWMQAADLEIQQLEKLKKGGDTVKSPVILLSELQKKIQAAGLESSLLQLRQAANDSIEMNFQKVDFDKLINMLIDVITVQHVKVGQMAVTAGATPGMVDANISIKVS